MTDAKTKALEFFKDWSNYLLVTTVAALGWIAGKDSIAFSGAGVRAVCIVALALSIVFGILTLALIPLVQEQRKPEHESNYDVPVTFRTWSKTWTGGCTLKSLCFPQHVLFLLGIIAFALGTMFGDPDSMSKCAQIDPGNCRRCSAGCRSSAHLVELGRGRLSLEEGVKPKRPHARFAFAFPIRRLAGCLRWLTKPYRRGLSDAD